MKSNAGRAHDRAAMLDASELDILAKGRGAEFAGFNSLPAKCGGQTFGRLLAMGFAVAIYE